MTTSDDQPTGPIPLLPLAPASRGQFKTEGVDPRDPLGLGLPQAEPSADAPTSAAPGQEVGLVEFWDQAVELTREQDEAAAAEAIAAAAAAAPVAPPEPLLSPAPDASPPPPPPRDDDEPPAPLTNGEPAPLSGRWRVGIAAAVAVEAGTVAIVVAQLASSPTSSSPTQAAGGGGPAFIVPTTKASQPPGADSVVATPPGLAALPPPAASPSPAPTPPVNAPNVTVLNQTRVHGLASKEAEVIRVAGWTVRRVTNVNDRQPSTTVYYDPSQEAAAKALVAAVPSVKVALPRPHYLLRTGGLIVVVAADAA